MKKLFFATCIILFSSMLYGGVASNVSRCKCGDEGVTLSVISGCEGWDDATQCSGWASVAHANGMSEEDYFEDKTPLTAYDCTIQINCPPSDNRPDAGETVTIEKKEDTGWCSILLLD
jgi:hypothetical protein